MSPEQGWRLLSRSSIVKHLLLTFLCLLSFGCVPAAVTSSPGAYGRVTDTQTNVPLANARVTFPGRGPAVTTNAVGWYDLPHTTKFGIVVLLPFDFQTLPLRVSHAGYQTVTLQIRTILARYQINCRVGLLAKTLRTYYLDVSYEAQGYPLVQAGSVTVGTSQYMPDEHKILNMTKKALAERFGYDRVFIGHYHPFNF